jgi:xanthine dehydrogenase YagT iron-sulfur-binding subunit
MSDHRSDRPKNPSRRRFLAGVGLAGAGAALAKHAQAFRAKAPTSVRELTVPLVVNGKKRSIAVEARTTLLSALREHLVPPLIGPKQVCDQGACGACTVLLEGRPVNACLVLAADAIGARIVTAEGLGTPGRLNDVQAALIRHDGLMCGYCTPGFVVTLSALLDKNANPSLAEVQRACAGNFCRCGTYPRVFEAALSAAKERRSRARVLGG